MHFINILLVKDRDSGIDIGFERWSLEVLSARPGPTGLWIPYEGYNVWKDDEGNKVQRNLRFKLSKGQVFNSN